MQLLGVTFPCLDLWRGLWNQTNPPKYREIWDVKIVLDFLQTLYPVKGLTLKNLTLKFTMLFALTSAQRCETLQNTKELMSLEADVNNCWSVIKIQIKGWLWIPYLVGLKRFWGKLVSRTLLGTVQELHLPQRLKDQMWILGLFYKQLAGLMTKLFSKFYNKRLATDTNFCQALLQNAWNELCSPLYSDFLLK